MSSQEEAYNALMERAKAELDKTMGSGAADKTLGSASDFTRPGVEYVVRNAFDGVWGREGLERKYRSLVVISILASGGMLKQLKSHVRGGLNNGLKEEEIREAMMHVMGYCGFPRGLDAFAACAEAIASWKAEKGL